METPLLSIAPDKTLTFGKGFFHVWYPSPRVLRLAAHGHGEAGLAQLVCKEMEDAGRRAGQPIAVFTDDRPLTGYEPAYRVAFETWLPTCWDWVASIHLLVDSSLVELGMSVVSMKIGERGIYEMYRDFPDWYDRYQEALR
ncbi:MAG: hypothetical protein ABI134_20870 [Byssovorax sp.]